MDRSIPEDVVPTLCTAVGHVVLNWTFVEQSLDHWSSLIFLLAGGSHVEDEIPRMAGRKFRFLDKCFRRLAALKPFADEASKFLETAKRLVTVRQGVTHGVASDFDSLTGALVFVKIDLDKTKTMQRTEEFRTSLTQLLSDGNACQDLAAEMFDFTDRLIEALIPQEQVDQLPSRLGRQCVAALPAT